MTLVELIEKTEIANYETWRIIYGTQIDQYMTIRDVLKDEELCRMEVIGVYLKEKKIYLSFVSNGKTIERRAAVIRDWSYNNLFDVFIPEENVAIYNRPLISIIQDTKLRDRIPQEVSLEYRRFLI